MKILFNWQPSLIIWMPFWMHSCHCSETIINGFIDHKNPKTEVLYGNNDYILYWNMRKFLFIWRPSLIIGTPSCKSSCYCFETILNGFLGPKNPKTEVQYGNNDEIIIEILEKFLLNWQPSLILWLPSWIYLCHLFETIINGFLDQRNLEN